MRLITKTPQSSQARTTKGNQGGITPWFGLTPSQRVRIRTVVPTSVNLVPSQDGVDLVEFVLAQRDVHRGEVFQDL